MTRCCAFLLVSIASVSIAAPKTPNDPGALQQVYEKVFGDAVRLDPAMVKLVMGGKPGERHYADRNNDGRPDEVWYVDTDPRHPEQWRPVLVRAIDEDSDLLAGAEPDLDSDLYVADWHGDGVVDAVTDYTDRDGDGDVDEMAFYFAGSPPGAPQNSLMVWWGDDVGDDNLLWSDVGYTYRQSECQYRTHFGGDELFCAFGIELNDTEWVCFWENPFLFYDHDGDGVTEEVIRFSGRNEHVGDLRYSFDADNDATADSPRDFDVSISAHAPEGLTLDLRVTERRILRGIPSAPFLRYHVAPQYCRETQWADYLLTWDEDDLNFDGNGVKDGRFTDTQERWEGVIARGTDGFKQIGGPNSGEYNERFEIVTEPKGPMKLYYAPTDQRLHLLGAQRAWLHVDFDYDQKPDMRYEYLDGNGDGYVDTWTLDVDNDGDIDDTWTGSVEGRMDIRYTFGEVNAVMGMVVRDVPPQVDALCQRLQQALEKQGIKDKDVLAALLVTGFEVPGLDIDLRTRLAGSNESMRYFLDLLKDRLIVSLKQAHKEPDFWTEFDGMRARGDLAGMQAALERAFSLEEPLATLDALRGGMRARLTTPRVAWAQDWVPPNIGWESEVCGYRAYWGQFDFFGKHGKQLVLETFGDKTSYHEEQPWGMDALHVGASAGIGGVTLYVNGEGFPVRSPNGEGGIVWSKKLVSESDEEVAVELLADNVGRADAPYAIRFLCKALAGRKDSPIEVTIAGGKPDDAIELGIGLTRLPQETYRIDTQNGIMANWGIQQAAIGTIGMGVLFDPKAYVRCLDTADEHQVIVRPESGVVRYRIQGDWLRGRRFNRCPTLENWVDELARSATR